MFKQISKNADLVSNFNAGYLLSYIQAKGNLCTTYKELQEETGLTKGKINRALEILLSLDLLEVEREKETRNIKLKIKLKIKNLSEKNIACEEKEAYILCEKIEKTYTREDLLTPEDEESLKKFHEQINKEHKELTQKVDEVLKKRQEEKKKNKDVKMEKDDEIIQALIAQRENEKKLTEQKIQKNDEFISLQLSVVEREEREEKEKEKKKESNTKKEIKEKEKEEKEEGPKTSFLVDEINNLPKIKLNSKSNNVYLFYLTFNDLYQKKYHTSVLKSSKTMRMCKYIISCINQDYWEKVVTAFLNDNNPYLLNRQHDISLLAQDIQKYYNLAVNPEIKKVISIAKVQSKVEDKENEKDILEKQNNYKSIKDQVEHLLLCVEKDHNTIAQHNLEGLLAEIQHKYPGLYSYANEKFQKIKIQMVEYTEPEKPVFHDVLKTDVESKKEEKLPDLPEDLARQLKEKMEEQRKRLEQNEQILREEQKRKII